MFHFGGKYRDRLLLPAIPIIDHEWLLREQYIMAVALARGPQHRDWSWYSKLAPELRVGDYSFLLGGDRETADGTTKTIRRQGWIRRLL